MKEAKKRILEETTSGFPLSKPEILMTNKKYFNLSKKEKEKKKEKGKRKEKKEKHLRNLQSNSKKDDLYTNAVGFQPFMYLWRSKNIHIVKSARKKGGTRPEITTAATDNSRRRQQQK